MLRGGGGQRWAPELSIAAAPHPTYLEFREELMGMTWQAVLVCVHANSFKWQKDFLSALEFLCRNTRYYGCP